MSDGIAVVGLACEYADARSPAELWKNVLSGRRAFRRMPTGRLSTPDYVDGPAGTPDAAPDVDVAVIEGYSFDRAAFGISGDAYRAADLAHWLAVDVAARAWADAGLQAGSRGADYDRATTAVVLGNTLTGEFSRANALRLRWPYARRAMDAALAASECDAGRRRELLARAEVLYKAPFPVPGEETLAGSLSNTIAGRVCAQLGFGGGGFVVDGACASSLLAVAQGCAMIRAGEATVVLAGGIDLSLDPLELVGFARAGALAVADNGIGPMRVFDARPTGFCPGEGCGVAVLIGEAVARSMGLRPYAVIRGWGVSSDGGGHITRPAEEGQLRALRRAYERAQYGIGTVEYFEAHGTGTAVGDAIELAALTRLLEEDRRVATNPRGRPPAAIGSVKTLIGHTKAAAGIAGLIKAVMALRHRTLPPTVGCEQPHAELCRPDARLRVLTAAEPWPTASDGREPRASVSAFGFGGINVHVTMESGETSCARDSSTAERSRVRRCPDGELFLFGAADTDILRREVARLLDVSDHVSYGELGDLAAATAGHAAVHHGARAAVVASSPRELRRRLRWLADLLEGRYTAEFGDVISDKDSRAFLTLRPRVRAPRVGMLFPGQGAPLPTLGGAAAWSFPCALDLLETVDGAQAADTSRVQPAIARAALAGLHVLREAGVVPAAVVGHSLGEFVALHAAGCFNEDALLRLASARGRAMADAGDPSGRMAAVTGSVGEIGALIRDGDAVWISADNGPGQTVLSGAAAALDRVLACALERGYSHVRLNVSRAFHSPLVEAATSGVAAALDREVIGRATSCRVFSTVTGSELSPGDDLCRMLVRQVTCPVQFHRAMRTAGAENAADLWLEVGPGDTLSRLAQPLTSRPVIAIDVGGRKGIVGLLVGLAAAFVHGVDVRTDVVYAGRTLRPFTLPWEPRFFASPCESIAEDPSAVQPRLSCAAAATTRQPTATHPPPRPDEPGARDAETTLIHLRHLVAQRAQLPLAAVHDRRPLSAYLSSITAAEVMGQLTRERGLAPLVDPTLFSTSTLAAAAAAVDDGGANDVASPVRTARPSAVGVDAWVRPFEVDWVESPSGEGEVPLSAGAASSAGKWELFTNCADALTAHVRDACCAIAGEGVLLVLRGEPELGWIPLCLAAARAFRDTLAAAPQSRFVLVHDGAGWSAFARSLFFEHPAAVSVIEFYADDANSPARVAHELRVAPAGGFHEVRLTAEGGRQVRRLVNRPLVAVSTGGADGRDSTLPVGPGDVVLVTGGGKGIGAACARALAAASGARLALVGRSDSVHDREIRANLNEFANCGVNARYFRCDVSDPGAVRECVRQIERELGRVIAVIHAAGTNDPASAAEINEVIFSRAVAGKVTGAINVLDAIDVTSLRLFVAFGSVVAETGMAGEAHYAAANQWLGRVVERAAARHPQCRFLVLAWSVWSGVGMGERLGRIEALRRAGVGVIAPDEGARQFVDVLRGPAGFGGRAAKVVIAGPLGEPPTLPHAPADSPLPKWRFLERIIAHTPEVELVAEADLTCDSDPYVSDHAFRGDRLLPAAIAVEAMAQVTAAVAGVLHVAGFANLAFDRPVVVPWTGTTTIRIAALVRGRDAVDVVVRCSDTAFAVNHFRATARLTRSRTEPASVRYDAVPEADGPCPDVDLYGVLAFQTGRFRRVVRYRVLRPTACQAVLSPLSPQESWFGHGRPPAMLWQCPAVRDAAIHAIQACLPHVHVLPIAARQFERYTPADHEAGEPARQSGYVVRAREVGHTSDTFDWDVDLCRESDDAVVERWSRLRFKVIGRRRFDSCGWPPELLGLYIERCLSDAAITTATARVQVSTGSTQTTDSVFARLLANGRDGGTAPAVHRRPDGRPVLPGDSRGISAAHAGPATFAVTVSEGAVGCDVEVVSKRDEATWRDLLGDAGLELARGLAAVTRSAGHSADGHSADGLDAAATLVWAASESLKKAFGSTGAPLVVGAPVNVRSDDGDDTWIRFDAGGRPVVAFITRVTGFEAPLAFAVAVGAEVPSPRSRMMSRPAGQPTARRAYEHRVTVTFEDTNALGNVYFTNHLAWQGRVRELFLREHAPGVAARIGKDVLFVTSSVACDYFRELHAFDNVVVRMTLARRDATSLTMAFEYVVETTAGPAVAARGRQVLCCIHPSTRAPAPVPDELVRAAARFPESGEDTIAGSSAVLDTEAADD